MLVLPHGLRPHVRFEEGQRWGVEILRGEKGVDRLPRTAQSEKLSWVCETIATVKAQFDGVP
jgi:hypothetical protein